MRQGERERLLAARNQLARAFSDGESTDFIAGLVELDEILGLDTAEAREWLDALANAHTATVCELPLENRPFGTGK